MLTFVTHEYVPKPNNGACKIVAMDTSTLHQPLRHLRAFVAFHLDRGMNSLQLFL